MSGLIPPVICLDALPVLLLCFICEVYSVTVCYLFSGECDLPVQGQVVSVYLDKC